MRKGSKLDIRLEQNITYLKDVIEKSKEKNFTVFSLFAGGGGSSTGYKMAGGDVLGINEYSKTVINAYLDNYPNTKTFQGDIRGLTARKILKELNIKKGELDLLDGSPPCTSFSMQGLRELEWGKAKKSRDNGLLQRTDDLFLEYARVLKGLQPKTFVAENVKSLSSGMALSLLGFPREFLNYISEVQIRAKVNRPFKDEMFEYIKHIIPRYSKNIDKPSDYDIEYYTPLFKKLMKTFRDIKKNNKELSEEMNFCKSLEKAGYKVNYRVIGATDFGVAQIRERLIIIGVRNDLAKRDFKPIFPEVSHLYPKDFEEYQRAKERNNRNGITTENTTIPKWEKGIIAKSIENKDDRYALKDLKKVVNGKDVLEHLLYDIPDMIENPLRKNMLLKYLKRPKKVKDLLREVLKDSKVSLTEEQIDNDKLVRPECTTFELSVISEILKIHSGVGIFGSHHYRNFWKNPSLTLSGSTRLSHPILNRLYSIREGLNVSSFPEDYVLKHKSYNKNWYIVGNAVAPKMMKAISEHIYNTVISPNKIQENKEKNEN